MSRKDDEMSPLEKELRQITPELQQAVGDLSDAVNVRLAGRKAARTVSDYGTIVEKTIYIDGGPETIYRASETSVDGRSPDLWVDEIGVEVTPTERVGRSSRNLGPIPTSRDQIQRDKFSIGTLIPVGPDKLKAVAENIRNGSEIPPKIGDSIFKQANNPRR